MLLFKRTYGFILLLTTVLVTPLCAQKFTATVNVNTVAVGQQFKLTYTLEGNGDNFIPPRIENFRVLSGPNTSNNVRVVNGQMSSSITISYILQPVKQGRFEIPPGKVTMEGKTVESNPVVVNVLKKSDAQLRQEEEARKKAAAQRRELTDNIFIKLFVSKRKVYQGEQFVATYKIYTRLNIVNTGIDQWPAFTGFYSQEVNSDSHNHLQPEVIDGMRFDAAVLKQVVLSPQRSGELKIDPLEMDVIVRVPDNRAPRSAFDQFFGRFKDVELKLKSNGAKISVTPLPSKGKTPAFNGAVGSFDITSNIDKSEVKTNEAINLKIEIKGRGNLKLLKDPELDFPPDFEVYDPKEKANISTTANGVSGSKSFEYLIIPRHSGEFTIPSIEFSYFNPSTGSYGSLKTDEYQIVVSKGSGDEEAGATAVRPVRKKDVALLGKDIRYIKKGNPKLREAGSAFFGSTSFWIFLLLPAVMFGGLLVTRKRLREMQADVVGMKKRKAGKIAGKYLANAKKQLNAGNTNEFYEDVFRSLFQYMSMKLNIPVSELDKESLERRLLDMNIDDQLVKNYIQILSECEMARYAPAAAMNESELFEKANEVINKIDAAIK